jgi:hypothetical protein
MGNAIRERTRIMDISNTRRLDRGQDFRPRANFQNEGEYLHQFLWLARPKLTKKLFLSLPQGVYVVGNVPGFEATVAPIAERATQWKSIPPGSRQRLCMIFRNQAHYEAMLAQGGQSSKR